MAQSTYLIQPQPPVRAFVIAAISALLGALLLVGALAWEWHVVVAVLGGVFLAAGVVLTVAGFISMSRLTVQLVFDEDGYAVRGLDVEQSGKWLDVTKLTVSEDGGHVTIYHGVVRRTHLLFPARDRALVDDVLADATARLRQSRA
ncbi:MAG: hypothetical protein IPJ61_03335 [Tessaracoccus sp.]|uniref:hypothetical protein n=1 Tax=Tessaracoccus sp. TaxID=1971211 RepID=UPI001EB12825|nr:hypothetical protein [Tessaracoccus sp.]MBK7820118.1 hypothetical protein [Tessaracoccus sp.]